jgi:hypothetical protein
VESAATSPSLFGARPTASFFHSRLSFLGLRPAMLALPESAIARGLVLPAAGAGGPAKSQRPCPSVITQILTTLADTDMQAHGRALLSFPISQFHIHIRKSYPDLWAGSQFLSTGRPRFCLPLPARAGRFALALPGDPKILSAPHQSTG